MGGEIDGVIMSFFFQTSVPVGIVNRIELHVCTQNILLRMDGWMDGYSPSGWASGSAVKKILAIKLQPRCCHID